MNDKDLTAIERSIGRQLATYNLDLIRAKKDVQRWIREAWAPFDRMRKEDCGDEWGIAHTDQQQTNLLRLEAAERNAKARMIECFGISDITAEMAEDPLEVELLAAKLLYVRAYKETT